MRVMNFFNPFRIFDFIYPLTTNTTIKTDSNGCVEKYEKRCITINNGVKNSSYVNLTRKDKEKDYKLNTKYTTNDKIISEESKVVSDTEAKNIINEKFNTNSLNYDLINFEQSLNSAIMDINNHINRFRKIFNNIFWW